MAERKPISYLRDRDYSQHFIWTYELNKDVYNCYKNARSDRSIGYMKRLKRNWDKIHPELSHFNEKQLRQQATFVAEKEAVLATNLEHVDTENGNDTNLPNPNVSNQPTTSEVKDREVDGNTSGNQYVCDESLLISLKTRLLFYIDKYKELPLEKREYECKVTYAIKEDEWSAINIVIREYIENTNGLVDLWLINVIQYSAIVTLLEKHNQLKVRKKVFKTRDKPSWLKHIEEKICNLQRKVAHIELIIKCRIDNVTMSGKQKNIERRLRSWFGNTKHTTLTSKLSLLKHDLRVAAQQQKNRLKIDERNRINKTFAYSQKSIFRDWKSKKVNVDTPPPEKDITSFWGNIWSIEKTYNENASWMEKLRKTYCVEVKEKNYEINSDTLQKVLNNMKNDKAPGRDHIKCFWIKKLISTHNSMIEEYKLMFNGEKTIPDWLTLGMTILLPKNTETHNAKNYRPIACQNITYKIFTGIIYSFIDDHCITNDIITLEQAGGKKGSWGCADQLLINKMALEEVSTYRRNLFTMWFDYRKAFDMIPHKWLIKALELAKIPTGLIHVIKMLTQHWSTKIYLNHSHGSIETGKIQYLNGLMQGDTLSLLLFELCVNPLSHLLNLLPGYKLGKPDNRSTKLSHLFFVDDLKTFASDEKSAKMQLDLITTFTKDIGMQFGSDKCAYLCIQHGERKTLGSTIEMNNLELMELPEGELYKYLGMDEDIAINGTINKEKVRTEYFRRIRKIWNSELYSHNKICAHNTFAIPVLTPTFGILKWSKEELEQIDVKTRKLLTLSGSFHRNSDIDRLYSHRKKGGRGLNSISDTYLSRIASLMLHINEVCDKSKYIALVKEHEEHHIIRQGNELLNKFNIDDTNPKVAARKIKDTVKDEHLEKWLGKKQHGYLFKTRENIRDSDTEKTHSWLTKSKLTSHMEGYICAIQEEEINTRGLQKRRTKNTDNQDDGIEYKCRICHQETETIQHVLACCERLRISLYLPVRHNTVAFTLYHLLTMSKKSEITEVYRNENIEIWWDVKIKTKPALEHNKPDMLLWRINEKRAFLIDIVVGLDVNITKNYKRKLDYYMPLCIEMKKLYPDYSFEVIPISIGATGLIMKNLSVDLIKIGIDKKIVPRAIMLSQKAALLGSVKIVKSVMSY